MGEAELKQRLHDAERRNDLLHEDLRQALAAFADTVTANSRLKDQIAELLTTIERYEPCWLCKLGLLPKLTGR